jgi:signal transduction histidine kinase
MADPPTVSGATSRDLEITALAGFSVLVVLLAVGMTFSILRFEAEAGAQVLRIRAEEKQISLVERLRWFAELIVSDGRGYLFAGEPSLLARVQESKSHFVLTLGSVRGQELTPREQTLAREADRAADSFIRVQQELLDARQQADDSRELARRFETELLPSSGELDRSLSKLVEHKEVALAESYASAKRARAHLAERLYGLLGVLVVAAVGVAWNFSQRLGRAFRSEHEALESARKALEARDELMGIVAHDLRNPLGAITIKAALLQKGADLDRTKKQAESIANIAKRMEYLIRTMLDVTTMEAGRFSVSVARCSVADLIGEAAATFDALAASKQVRFEQLAKESGLMLLADRERVLQVLSNLIGNALKFTPPGGRVMLSVQRQPTMVRFEVLDTGPGITAENLPRVFDRFWTEAPGKKGTGLGLFIAKGIVDAHGGSIWAESDRGCGARFFFTLPIAEPIPGEVPRPEGDARLHPV